MTLPLGPPGSGKTTLLLALAGKLGKASLKFSGRVTYNGIDMGKFVSEKTSAYVSQHDLHIPELTVRETLDFAARCQGVKPRYEMLVELLRREKAANIMPDLDLDLYMKATTLEGQETSIVTNLILKVLGLEDCSDIMVGDEMSRGISGGQEKRLTMGYYEQTDIHSPHVTVYESLVYSAWLRLPREVDSPTRKMFIMEVMKLVEMTSISDRLVGFPGVNGLSTEQRKRLTIAVELVACNPSIIFMDEPTSCLDARAAAIIMRTVRNTVDTGRTYTLQHDIHSLSLHSVRLAYGNNGYHIGEILSTLW